MEWKATGVFEEGAARIRFEPVDKPDYVAFVKANGPVRLRIVEDEPESDAARGRFEGGVVSLITYYQEGMDHRKSADRRKVRDWLKMEFNSEIVSVAGKPQHIAKSSKGKAVFYPYAARVEDWLIENYD